MLRWSSSVDFVLCPTQRVNTQSILSSPGFLGERKRREEGERRRAAEGERGRERGGRGGRQGDREERKLHYLMALGHTFRNLQEGLTFRFPISRTVLWKLERASVEVNLCFNSKVKRETLDCLRTKTMGERACLQRSSVTELEAM